MVIVDDVTNQKRDFNYKSLTPKSTATFWTLCREVENSSHQRLKQASKSEPSLLRYNK